MKSPFLLLFFWGLIISSCLIGKLLYSSYHSDNIIAVFMYIILGIIWLWCFYRIFKKERRNSTTKFKATKYGMSVLSVLTLFPILCIFLYYQRKLNVKTLIVAQRHGVYADFKVDGTYIIKSGAWASRKHFYGKYMLRDSIIQLDTKNLDNILTSNLFLIRSTNLEKEKNRPDYDKLVTDKYLVQIDQHGNEILARHVGKETLPYKFEIVIDNRE